MIDKTKTNQVQWVKNSNCCSWFQSIISNKMHFSSRGKRKGQNLYQTFHSWDIFFLFRSTKSCLQCEKKKKCQCVGNFCQTKETTTSSFKCYFTDRINNFSRRKMKINIRIIVNFQILRRKNISLIFFLNLKKKKISILQVRVCFYYFTFQHVN